MLNSCTITVDMRNAFDNYIEPIYWDQGHVSDKGNLVIAELIFKKILILIEEDDIQQIPSTYQISERAVEKELGFEEDIRNLISYYKTPIMLSNFLKLS